LRKPALSTKAPKNPATREALAPLQIGIAFLHFWFSLALA
jgi:hypothetical protein